MTYIENIFICLAAPMLIGAICAGRKYAGVFVLVITGFAVCLLSAYINTFFTNFYRVDFMTATVEITPVVEEVMKLIPLLFYLLIFQPSPRKLLLFSFAIAVSFATFENVCYLAQNGATEFEFLLIRGLGAGAMHVVCGAIVGYGFLYMWKEPWLKLVGTLTLLTSAVTYHAIYNLLIGSGGMFQTAGFIFPVGTVLVAVISVKISQYVRQEKA